MDNQPYWIKPRPQDSLGQWNAWVEKGETKDEQLYRYDEAPAHYKAQIASHMRTVQRLKNV